MTFYPVMGSRSAVWHDQGMNKAPKTRRQGILGGLVTWRTKELVARPMNPTPIRVHHSLAIGQSGRMLEYEKNNEHLPVEWKDLFKGPLGVAARKPDLGRSGSQEGVVKKTGPQKSEIKLDSTVDTRPIKRAVGLESVAKWFAAKESRPLPFAKQPIPAKGSTYTHGL